MSKRITVHQDQTAIYDIVLEHSFDLLGAEVAKLKTANKKICIVTDTNVAPLYLEQVCSALQSQCRQIDTFIFSAGEEHKQLSTVSELYEHLILKYYDRGDFLVALGGGVVGDLCGYAAATYLRGISFIQIPTTLLSQVDSSIGGKTGVDFQAYKNMVGAFHMPRLVYTNITTLKTLSDEQYVSGMGEIIKHGLIKNADYYHWLNKHNDFIMKRDPDTCETMIYESNQIKQAVVEQDPTEQGDRALLNFGHTLGHAIEKLCDFKMLHGHCVALGSLAAAYLSALKGYITMDDVENIKTSLLSFQLPVTIAKWNFDHHELINVTRNDKKMDADTIKFVLLQSIGHACIDRTVTAEEMGTALAWEEEGT